MKKIAILFIVLFICLFCGCSKENVNDSIKGLYCDVNELPRIEEFSGERYESYECCFPTIETATYINGDETTVIDNKDPRLFRLLNFILYSEEKCLSSWIQGYLDEEMVNETGIWMCPRLEVTFTASKDGSCAIERTYRIIISGDGYLQYSHGGPTPDGEVIERYWPYGSWIMDMIYERTIPQNAMSGEHMGKGYWIDLLEYAGF